MIVMRQRDQIVLVRGGFDFRSLCNRRFMFAPSTGELILGGADIAKSSHAAEHGMVAARADFDSFVRGWVCGVKSRRYPEGVIHFAPAFLEAQMRDSPEVMDELLKTLELFRDAGAGPRTLLRGAGAPMYESRFGEAYPEFFGQAPLLVAPALPELGRLTRLAQR
jgi:hypothetical protein